MDSTNKKAPGARGVPQPPQRQGGHAPQFKSVAQLKPGVSPQGVRRPVAPPVYRPQQVPKVLQTKVAGGQQSPAAQPPRRPAAPPVYRPEQRRVAQPKMASAAQARTPPKAPPAYRPQAKPVGVQAKSVSVQAKMAATAQMKARPAAPPVYRPQPVPKVLQPARSSRNVHGAANQPPPKPAARLGPAAGTVQRYVDAARADTTSNGKYLVKHDDSTVLYSTLDAAPPQPMELYARGYDYTTRTGVRVDLHSWTPNVRFIDKTEAQAEPVLDKPGTYTYKSGFLGTKSYSVRSLQEEVENPAPGLDGPPTVGALGKNDCNIWATTLQNLIAERSNSTYQVLRGRQVARTVSVQSERTTERDLHVDVGDRMKHIYQGQGACRYHAATVVAKDGPSLVTLEGHVSKDLSRPQFHVRSGLRGFAEEGITHGKGDQVEIVPVTSLSSQEVDNEIETREDRFQGFSDIDPDFWRGYEGQNYSYRGRLVGDIGVTLKAERLRRSRAYDRALSESLSRPLPPGGSINRGDEGNTFILNDML